MFVGQLWTQTNIKEALLRVYTSHDFKIAILRLYGFFTGGQLFLGLTSQHELLTDLKKVDLPAIVVITIVLIFNSIAYFISFYSDIKRSYEMRCIKSNVFKKMYYVFSSLTFEALSMIVNCRKILFIDDNRIKNIVNKPVPDSPNNTVISELNVNLKDISYYDCKDPVIRDLETFFPLGTLNIVWGENGIGKSTLFDAITGVIPNIIKAEGSILLNLDETDKNITGYVPQGVERSLLFDTPESMLKDVPISKREIWLKKFMLSHIDMETRNMNELSSGERKKFELISELLYDNHKIVLLDEPTAFLDDSSKDALFELLTSVKNNKIIVIITHDTYFKDKEATWHHMIDSGIVKESFCIPQKDDETIDSNLDLLDGCKTEKKVFKKRVKLRNDFISDFNVPVESIEIENGKNIAILGKNGCGKTTLDKNIFECLRKSKARIRCLMMLQEVNKQFFTSSVEDEIFLCCRVNNEFKQFVYLLLEYVGLLKYKDFPPYFLSGGQKRILLLLCFIAQRPDVIILDEPFEFIDEKNRKKLIDLLVEYQKRSGICYVLSDQTLDCFQSHINEKIVF
ncbi:MAG: ATP-binding cassette domain-containing protein [Clostridia bacterium]|nr:ATP-binding cassette domain-containing protein [Clostridia bacterium]